MQEIKQYEHKVQYYETDQMAVVHHSNYIRWFEEARTYFLEEIGCGYDEMEAMGIISPVLSVNAEYKSMTRYGETVCIDVRFFNYTGVKFGVRYSITDKVTGEVRCIGESRHCFLKRDGSPMSLKRAYPEVHELLERYVIRD